MIGTIAPSGTLTLQKFTIPGTFWSRLRAALPSPGLPREVLVWRLRNLPSTLIAFARLGLAVGVSRLTGLPLLYGTLTLCKYTPKEGWLYYGVAGVRVVTTVGVNFIVDAFQNLVEAEDMKYHGFGTGGAAEAVGNTALTTELTTEYVVNSTRPTGTLAEGASANIFRTVGTLSPDSGGTLAITEHGVFSASTAGTLLDRTLFSAVNLVAGSDSLQATYELTFTAGS